MRALAVLATVLVLAAAAVYGYSLTLDTSESTSDQNVTQYLAGLLVLASVVCASLYGFGLARRRDRKGG